jgi:hypothetical protein
MIWKIGHDFQKITVLISLNHAVLLFDSLHEAISLVVTHFGSRSFTSFRMTTPSSVILSGAKNLSFCDIGLNL